MDTKAWITMRTRIENYRDRLEEAEEHSDDVEDRIRAMETIVEEIDGILDTYPDKVVHIGTWHTSL